MIDLNSNDNKRIQSIDSIQTYKYTMNKHVVCKKEKDKDNIVMFNFGYITKEDKKKQNIRILIVFDDMTADMISNKLNAILTELFIRGRELNSRFALLENSRLNSTHYFYMKIRNERELQQIPFNHLSDIHFRIF